jgi:L-ascorbate metabolism protein UlaG (beta-lactamase superfamily)
MLYQQEEQEGARQMATIGKNTQITWLGHATFHIVTPEGKRVLVDAWVDGNPSCPDEWKPKAREGLEAIFLTHGHFDHVTDITNLANETGALVVCQFDLAGWLQEMGVEENKIIGYNKGGTVEVAGVKATMTAAQHSSTGVDSRGTLVPLGDPAGYILRFSNDFAIYVTGDTSVTADMQIMGELYKPDLTILPIGDYFTMDPFQGAYALKLINSPYAIGCHWGTFPLLTGTPEALMEHCKAFGVSTQVLPLKPGESVD